MGFFDSFKKSFDKAKKEADEEKKKAQEHRSDNFRYYNSKSDGELIRLSSYSSGEEKGIIDRILHERGYNKDNRGWFKGYERL